MILGIVASLGWDLCVAIIVTLFFLNSINGVALLAQICLPLKLLLSKDR
jgi:hypothetical protein